MENDEQIAALIGKGMDFSQDDLAEVNMLVVTAGADQAFERFGWAYEAISLIVNDPLYTGNVKTTDLAD